jgi:biopolymer transport protein ExbD
MPLKTQKDELPQLNLTSMIDVVFLLIVFFMVAAKFGDDQKNIDLRLQEVGGPATLANAPKASVIVVQADGKLMLDGAETTVRDLPARLGALRAQRPQLTIVIRGDAACPFQHIASAMAACKEAGVSDLGVSVRVAQAVVKAKR